MEALEQRDPITGAIPVSDQQIQVAGPGQLTVVRGRNINLGSSNGISSIGNLNNPNLPSGGANLTILAGLAGGVMNVTGFAQDFLSTDSSTQAYSDYISQYSKDYLVQNPSATQAQAQAAASSSLNLIVQNYNNALMNLVGQYSASQPLTAADALTAFNNLFSSQQADINEKLLPYVQQVYFSDLKYFSEQRAPDTLTSAQKDQYELDIQATTETLFPGTTLLAGNSNYSYNMTSGWQAINNYTVDDVIKSMDTGLLQSIQSMYGDTISLGGGVTLDLAGAIQAIKNSDNSVYGKNLISSIFSARPDIQAAVRPSKGDITMYYSAILTKDGGNINLLAPNGGINAGLAATSLGLAKTAAQLGIIAQAAGGINAELRDDFAVNLNRVMTLGGGDIVAGSTEGNIDAGKGATGTGALAPAQVSYDLNGNPVIYFPPSVDSSGIRSATPINSSVLPGQIVLFAPRGIIDAGEAGIAGGNLYLDAGKLSNVANITSSTGFSVGTPPASASSVSAGISGTSSVAASVTKSIESAVAEKDSDASKQAAKNNTALGLLSVDLLGFGDENPVTDRKN